jgi:hypothetical protein
VTDEAADDVRKIEAERGDDDRRKPDYGAEEEETDENGRILSHAQRRQRGAKDLGEIPRPGPRPDVRA